jgi:hypothetical protein
MCAEPDPAGQPGSRSLPVTGRRFGGLSAGGSNLQFNAAIGPIGAFVKDGRANLSLDFSVTGNDGNAGPTDLGAFLSNLQANLTGSASATLPVYFPTDSQSP